jgi:8-oxo-dGTP diphosphatase
LISNILRITHKLDLTARVVGGNRAAVVLILHDSEGLDALFVKRKTSPSDPWSGQIALPGGRFEPEDGSLIDTALREVMEEVGIDLRDQGGLLGTLDDTRPANMLSLIVTPFVALIGPAVPTKPGPEIEGAFWAPLMKLERIRYETPLITGKMWSGDAYHYEGHIIWGLTGHIVEDFLSLLGR